MNNKNKKLQKFIIILNSLFLIIIIIFSPLAFYVFNQDYYLQLYDNNGVFSVLNKTDVLKVTENIFNFFKYDGNLETIDPSNQVRFADEELSSVATFTQNEINHLDDVRILFSRILILFYISLVLFIILSFLFIEKNFRNFIRKLGITFIISSVSVLFIFIIFYFLANNFGSIFDKFHVIFFPQGNFLFSADSLIIRLFPFVFFYDFFISLITGSSVLSGILLAGGVVLIKIFKPLE